MNQKLNYGILGCLTALGVNAQKQTSEKPNIIIIFADDMGYGDLSCYGHPTIYTPNIDKLADEGMRCTQFYVAAAVSTPSRAGLMTGRYPYRYDLCTNGSVLFPGDKDGLSQNEITIAKALKQKDYATGIIGKWHLGDHSPYMPLDHGFDYYFGFPYSNDMLAGRGNNPPIPLYENRQVVETEPDQHQLTRRYTEKALSFLEKNKKQPFFLYFAHSFPHVPLFASEKFEKTSKRGLYGDVVQELDWSVGEIMKFLRDNKLDKNTLVVFTSDNGPWLVKNLHGGSAGLLRNGKGTLYEGGVRVPGIFWWPGVIQPHQVCNDMVSSLDLFPTIMNITGVPVPADRQYDGVNQYPMLKGESKSAREIYYYYYGDKLFAIRKGAWKLHFTVIEDPYTNYEQMTLNPPVLYNLNEDPSEEFNVAKQNKDVVNELKALAEKRLAEKK